MSEQEQRADETVLSEMWPTPWRVERDTNVVAADFPENGEQGIIVEATPTVDHARLIAAAPELRQSVEQNQGDVKTARAMLQDVLTGHVMDETEVLQEVIEVLDQADERADDALEGLA